MKCEHIQITRRKFLYFTRLQFMIVMSFVFSSNLEYENYRFPDWSTVLGWMISASSMACIPTYAAYRYMKQPGTLREVRFQ